MIDRRTGCAIPLLCLLFLAACSGGSGGSGQSSPNNPPPPPPPPTTSIDLTSDSGDYIGAGQSYSYTQADSLVTVSANGGHLSISVSGDESWSGEFQLPNTYTQLAVGVYTNLERYPFHDPAVGGLSWTGEGRGCNTSTGTITINDVVYNGTNLVGIDLEFEQYCDGGSAALRGSIYWDANDATSPPGPAAPPAGLWEPGAGVTPATGNYVYLESQAGDYIGQGGTYLYTPADAVITVSDAGGRLAVSINGNEGWSGDFQVMSSISFLEEGYYGDLERYPFHNPVKGGLSWSGEGRGCNRLTGWFLVDSVTYNGDTLTAIDLRFEQHCEGGGPALNGEIHWDVNDTTSAPGPVVPPPAGLWQPAAGVTPATGNYVYLESQAGDYIGQGGSYLYTPADSVINVSANSAYLDVSIDGDENWTGNFQGMDSLMRIEVGYYGDLQRYPFHNPVKGGLNWSGEGRGCNTLTGWFVVDSVTYAGTTLEAIDLRFEQHCEGGGPALHGAIHWDANDTTAAPGPVVPPPAGLWEPAPGVTPASGNYIYLQSVPGDWVGQGLAYLYTQADAILSVNSTGARLNVGVDGDEGWSGTFQGMNSLSLLEVGYYGDLQRYPFHNPVKGGLTWYGEGRGCNTLTGWFVIDNLTYNGSTLTAIDLRFEQHCDGGPALNGEIHWDANDTANVPGPVVPPPAGLWEPPPGVTPATGNYVYMESDFGDWVGQGQNYLYTQADSIFNVSASGARLDISITGDEQWGGTFQGMNSLSLLEVGYYGDLQRYPFHNPVKGGLSWSGDGRGCNELTGWFVIDNLTYNGNTLTAIDLRFEQHCDGGPALNGQIHWDVNDTTAVPGPVVPPPAGLWEPPAGVTPAAGNYVYLESDIGDWVGQGQNYLYTDADSTITIGAPGAALTVSVDGWNGRFQAMNSLNYLELGYYGDLQRYPFHNPAKGGLSWSGNGRGCNTLTGWFVVDSLTYVGVTLTAIDLRFEQHCDGGPALNGEIHWSQ
jgi:hypothetical protein